MTYQETLKWMFGKLPMYQRQGQSAFRADLANIQKLAKHLKHPEQKIKTIHVAGTNGKGSTSHMLASILQEAGYTTGLFTSPHLKDFRERIRINGQVVSKAFVIGFIQRFRSFFEQESLSFFEMTTGMAFEYFYQKKVDIAVIEVGLGGRLDSTNIIQPVTSVITNIGKDHVQFLGNTLEKIAAEKAGIIKAHIPVIIGETQSETEQVFIEMAENCESDIYFADQTDSHLYESDLKGEYQKKNIQTVVATVKVLRSKGYAISEAHVQAGLLNVVKNTGLRGRWEIIGNDPLVICDTGHNKEGLTYSMSQINNLEFEHLHIVFGVVNDKDLTDVWTLLPQKATYYFCKPDVPRGLDADLLMKQFHAKGYRGSAYNSVNQALTEAKNQANSKDLIFVGGSTFVVAEII